MSDHRTLYFEPLDVLQFRDYRPFDAGYNVLGQSTFPLPGVFLGCLRAALFHDQGADFSKPGFGVTGWVKELLGGPDPTTRHDRVGTLRLDGPLLARRGKGDALHVLFPMPVDLVPRKAAEPRRSGDAGGGAGGRHPGDAGRAVENPAGRADEAPYAILETRPTERSGDPEDDPQCYHRRLTTSPGGGAQMARSAELRLPWSRHELDKPHGGALFLTAQGARTYLNACRQRGTELALRVAREAEGEGADVVRQEKLLKIEDRFGIARDPATLTAKPQHFYLQRPLRLATHHGFAVEVHLPANADARKAIDRLHGRVVQLGGRGHHARIEVLERRLMPTELDGAAGPARKLWFLTPAPLRPGLGAWPEGVTVVADRLLPVGGFDQANRRPRPLLRALPAGSVVYLEPTRHPHDVRAELCGFSDGAPADIKDELERLRQAGFGMALPIGAEGGES